MSEAENTQIVQFAKINSKKNIKKIAFFTDIHFGKKNNSAIHNQDCLDFIDFFCEQVKKDKDINTIFFLGDWYENRNAVNVLTLNYSHKGLKTLNDLGIEIFFIIGNHDLHHRHHRKIHSAVGFEQYTNINVIEQPTVLNDSILLVPYIFGQEYANLVHYNNLKYFAGHFEFKNFVISGNSVMEHGPEHTNFKGPKYIFSGHFHKRQATDNVVYIGNTFPMDFGDAADDDRGMCVLDTATDDVCFENWDDCPKYERTTLSHVVDGTWIPKKKTRVKCLMDIALSYSEAQGLRQELLEEFQLREFQLEENIAEKQLALSESNSDAELDDLEIGTIDEMVLALLKTVNSTTNIEAPRLMEIYRSL